MSYNIAACSSTTSIVITIVRWFLVLSSLTTLTAAQTYEPISGQVLYDTKTADPVPEITFQVTDDNETLPISTRTDLEGNFHASVRSEWVIIRFTMPKVVPEWIIDDPVLEGRGRTLVPKKPIPFIIKVCRKGQRACLSVSAILIQRMFFFDDSRSVSEAHSNDMAGEVSWNRASIPFLMRTGYFPQSRTESGSTQDKDLNEEQWTAYLKKEADVIGLTLGDVRTMINDWSTHLQDPLDRGLYRLYVSDFKAASEEFQKAAQHRVGEDRTVQALVGVAYSEFKLGNVDKAGRYLDEALKFNPNDKLLRHDLAIVRPQSVGTQSGSSAGPGVGTRPAPTCAVTPLTNMGGVETVWAVDGGGIAAFAGMRINLDGYGRAYNAKDYEGGRSGISVRPERFIFLTALSTRGR